LFRVCLKRNQFADPDLPNFARAGIAIIVAILATIATASTIEFIPFVYWSMAGLCVAIVRMARDRRLQHSSIRN
jgi:hypothetical protein